MAYKTFTAGAVLTASDVNTYLAKQAVIVCTSTTRPSSPPEGMVIYETDTDKMLTYTTATTGWVPPWNLPWGVVASAEVTSAVQPITTEADITGLSVTWTAVANRRYRTTVFAQTAGNVADDLIQTFITDGSNAKKQTSTYVAPALSGGNWYLDVFMSVQETGISAGSVTRKVRMLRNAGTGTNIGLYPSATQPAQIIVEDMGPNGAPA